MSPACPWCGASMFLWPGRQQLACAYGCGLKDLPPRPGSTDREAWELDAGEDARRLKRLVDCSLAEVRRQERADHGTEVVV
jgi:hypothetical protein